MASMDEIFDYLDSMNYVNQPVTVERIVVSLLVTAAVALGIFGFYRLTFKGVLYSRNFNIGLVMTALVTALIILPISSNLLLSLGMVGALSIVRFRTAIKDPMDTVFMFWAIAAGLACGAGLYMVAVVGSPIIGVMILGFSRLLQLPGAEPYLLVVHHDGGKETGEAVSKELPGHKVRSRTVTGSGVELVVEMRLKQKDLGLADAVGKIKGVKDAALVSYSGDYAF